jgi:hypothetical protein
MILKFAGVLTFCVAVAVFAVLTARQVAAAALRPPGVPKEQGGIVLENVGATYAFGEQVTFVATIKSSIPIQNASIVIFDEGRGITHASPVAVQADGATQFVFDARQNTLRPFTFVRWHYEVVLADGSTFQSGSFFIRYDDNRFNWQRMESGALRVFWFQGDALFAEGALNVAVAGLGSINEFFPADLSQPVDIFIYPSQNELQIPGSEPWVVGMAEPSTGVALVAIEPGAEQSLEMERRIPHELMHVMLYRQLGAGYNKVPAWLSEGLATLVEINPTTEYDRVLAEAGARGALIPLPDLCASFPSETGAVYLAYAEARSFTAYLRDSFGSSALLDLAHRYADGVTCERGAELMYGASLAQLELRWRESTLGENALGVALQNMIPYLILCGMVLFIPLFIGFNAMRKKKK